jgi:hypothetical protein
MTNKLSLAALTALLATTLGGAGAFAQASAPQTSTPQRAPMSGPGMMQGGGMSQGGPMTQMDMTQMNRMMENCNKMMQSHLDRQDQGNPEHQPSGNRG